MTQSYAQCVIMIDSSVDIRSTLLGRGEERTNRKQWRLILCRARHCAVSLHAGLLYGEMGPRNRNTANTEKVFFF
jgi:hypothetical protein